MTTEEKTLNLNRLQESWTAAIDYIIEIHDQNGKI